MSEFTVKDLRRILEESSGVADGVDWDAAEVLDTPFDEIGYDSLARIELAARVQREYGVTVPEDAVVEMRTPRVAIDDIAGRLAEAGGR